jgi:UV DNA damage endonuclease
LIFEKFIREFVKEMFDEQYSVVLGLCCLNTELRKKNVFCSRTTPRSHYTVNKAKDLSLKNLADAETMMKWNHKHGITHFRLSSDMFPHYTDTEVESYDMTFADDALRSAGACAREYFQRITMHPGQFNQIGANKQEVFDKTVSDLSMHAEILDRMGTDPAQSILCIHGGGLYGDKEQTLHRWVRQFDDLPGAVKRRIAIECCEKCYSIKDCLHLSEECKIPVILDTHHDTCYRQLHPNHGLEAVEEYLPEVVESWRGVSPIFHVSEQRPGARVGAHSDYIENIPEYLLRLPDEIRMDVSIEVEAKEKEKAIFQLRQKYKCH